MSEFVDESGNKGTVLSKKIRKVQYEPEPTLKEFYQPIPINLRRPPRVQELQTPKGQVFDKFTEKGKDYSIARELANQAEADFKRLYEEENKVPGIVKAIGNILPSPAQLSLLTSLMTGNYPAALASLNRVAKESVLSKRQEVSKKKGIAQAARTKEERLKKKITSQKQQRTDFKGNKVDTI